ncbi:MAG: hypothetical protein WC322_00170 [Candidatus Paceibacterota bacterium]|jgi:hypothetical protein
MALLASTGLRTHVLGTGSLKTALAAGFLHIYSCAIADIPASADAAITASHTKLLTYYSDGAATGLNLGVAADGAIGKAAGETWSGTILATGNATFFRFVGSADTGAASTTEPRLQGRVGTAGAELNIDTLALTAGQTKQLNFVNINLPW